jgi:hypothetical protein
MDRILPTLGVSLAVLMTTGCAPTPATEVASIPLPVVEKLSDAALAELAEQDQDATLDMLLRQFPDAAVPLVERQRFIAPEESVTVMPECLTEEGFVTVGSADGSWTTEGRTEDAEKMAIATYICSSKFPIDPKYLVPLNDSQIAYIYRYQTEILTPCLEGAGYTVDAPPALEDFVASYFTDGGGWQPYEHVNAGDLTVSLNVQCPQIPGHIYG